MRALLILALAVGAPRVADAGDDPSNLKVCLQPLGKYDKKLLAPIARGITHLYGFTVVTLDAREMPEEAWYSPRKRYRADAILEWIDAEVAPESECTAVIGVTKHDISTTNGDIEDWGVFGLGEVGGVSAVISSYRLTKKAKRTKLVRRMVKVANHELGHVLGLEHTVGDLDPACVMNDAGGTIKTVDAERGTLCESERETIRIQHGVTLPERTEMPWAWVATGKGSH